MGSAQYSVKNEPSERTLYLRMAGFFEESEMKDFIRLYLEATASYGGKPHVVLADLRELQISSLDVSKLLGDAIGEGRKRGVTCCAHLTSATVVKMQMARLAREHSQGEDVTVNVGTLEEANKVLAEARLWMGLEAPAPEGTLSPPESPKAP
ncbi:hypothetical protein [Hyalangium minutum]|uniref:STAS domain-containing protein n=1 Tax=Hyalangium minutum TaxID=394096 RepID=A0A085WWN4_9BACT|nr:hypothetical protein [Hyalangium minutum]KFE72097.1 hypothetical protein DB31_0358 [Hyalangium minutum]